MRLSAHRFTRLGCGLGSAALIAVLALASIAGAATTKTKPKSKAPLKGNAKATMEKGGAVDSNRVLVKVGKESITVRDVQRRIDTLPEQFRANYASPEGRQQLLDRMVEERVWLSLAVQEGVADRPAVKQQIDQQRRDLLIRTYLNEVMGSNPAPSDSEAQVYYESHLSDYKMPATVTMRHIQSKSESDAKKVKKWAMSKGQDWNKLAKKYSADTLTKASGGSLGTVTREGVFPGLGSQPALAETAFAIGTGAIGGPVKTNRGWHIVKVDTLKEETVRPFDQVRPMILRQLGSQHSQDFYKARLEDARKKLGVKADSAAIKNFVSAKKSARDQFNDAQSAGPPEARIAAYRKLLEEYPESEVSPQAQFMIGFIYSEELKDYDQADQAFRELLRRYPKAELASSAQWMIDHMRTEDAPAFINLDSDSTAAAPQKATTSKKSSRSGQKSAATTGKAKSATGKP